MKKTRIAYCIPALYYPSGMERVLTLKVNYLVQHGYEIHIILTDGGDKPPYFPLAPSGMALSETYAHTENKTERMPLCSET